jgi:hypothetical protein
VSSTVTFSRPAAGRVRSGTQISAFTPASIAERPIFASALPCALLTTPSVTLRKEAGSAGGVGGAGARASAVAARA